jgi:hypothetical protein
VDYSLDELSTVTILLLDLKGNEIVKFESNGSLEQGGYQLQIEANNLAPGMYVLKYITDKKIETLSIIKQ